MISLLVLWLAAAPSEEAKEQARELVEQGNTSFESSRYKDAIDAYEEALALYPSPRILVNLAEAQREAGLWGSAQRNFQKFLDEGGAKPGSRIHQSLLARIREIEELAARLAITAFERDTELSIDGMPLGDPLEEPILLAPGRHELIARASGFETKAVTVILEPGAVLRLSLALEQKAIAAAPPVEAPVRKRSLRVIEAPRELLVVHEPQPFVEDETPVIESWWFWTIVGAVVLGAAAGTVALHNSVDVPESSELGASRFSTWEGAR